MPPAVSFVPGEEPGSSLRFQRVHHGGDAAAAAQVGVQIGRRHHREGRQAGPGRRRLGRLGDEGLGAVEGRHALRARLLSDDGTDRREARQLPGAGLRRPDAGRVRGQDPDPGRTGRIQLPVGRTAQHLRGPRLHRLGRHQPGLHPGEPERQHAVYPDGVRVDDRRGAGLQDAAAAQPAGDGHPRRAHPEAVRPRPAWRRSSRSAGPSRSTSWSTATSSWPAPT